MIDPYMIGTGIVAAFCAIGWAKTASKHCDTRANYRSLRDTNKGLRQVIMDLREDMDELAVQLCIAKSELRSAKAILDKRTERYRAGQAKSTASKAKARAEKVAKTLADLPAALAPMDVAA